MKIIDANILLYLANTRYVHYQKLLSWWEDLLASDERVGLPWIVIVGFLRISTNAAVFPKPLEPETAIEMVDAWLAIDQVRALHVKDEHWELLKTLLAESGTAGNLTNDAHLAAMAVSHGAVLVSCDNDFSRFKGLRWENPIESA
jgi:hypothetical protein